MQKNYLIYPDKLGIDSEDFRERIESGDLSAQEAKRMVKEKYQELSQDRKERIKNS